MLDCQTVVAHEKLRWNVFCTESMVSLNVNCIRSTSERKLNMCITKNKRKVGMVCANYVLTRSITNYYNKNRKKSLSIWENCLVFNHIQYSKFWLHHINVHKGYIIILYHDDHSKCLCCGENRTLPSWSKRHIKHVIWFVLR